MNRESTITACQKEQQVPPVQRANHHRHHHQWTHCMASTAIGSGGNGMGQVEVEVEVEVCVCVWCPRHTSSLDDGHEALQQLQLQLQLTCLLALMQPRDAPGRPMVVVVLLRWTAQSWPEAFGLAKHCCTTIVERLPVSESSRFLVYFS